MIKISEFKRNKALNRDLKFLISEFENIKKSLIKYKIYREVSSIIENINTGIIKYRKTLEKINNEK